MSKTVDIAVLGAGIVGVSAAVHLQKRGLETVLIDRQSAGIATSFGNAGLIQSEGVAPHAFPRDLKSLLRYARNNTVQMRYHPTALPALIPFLAQYWWHSAHERYHAIVRDYASLIAQSRPEHEKLIAEAGADELIRKNGWLIVCRSQKALDAEIAEANWLDAEFGVSNTIVDDAGLKQMEPHIKIDLAGGVHWREPWTVTDPHALTSAYFNLFEKLGGRFVSGDAQTLNQNSNGWTLETQSGPLHCKQVVICLGPWAMDLTSKLGYRLPLAGKRGYHRHFTSPKGKGLNNCMFDTEGGYFLAPMRAGIRLTTGVEFARRDAPKTPVQLARATEIAKAFLPLGEPVEAEPWMGVRPCTPDMKPIIGAAPRHKGLWFDFGHAHHGLTLGPASGRLIADLVTGEDPYTNPTPFRPERFRS